MRRLLLASVAILALQASPARAILGVGDIVYDPANHVEAMAQLTELLNILENGREILKEAEKAYDAANTATGLSGLGGGRTSPLADPSLGGLLNGQGGGGFLAGLMERFLGPGYRHYDPPGDDFQSEEIRRQRQSLSASMAAQEAVRENIAERMAALEGIRRASLAAVTESEKADVNRAFAAEMAEIQVLQTEVANFQNRVLAERENSEQRQREEQAMNLDLMHERLTAARGARLGQ